MSEMSSAILTLKPVHHAKIPAWLGRAAQANFLQTLQALFPDLSGVIHDMPGAKPFTSSTLIGARRRDGLTLIAPQDVLRLRYTTLHPKLTGIFQQALLPQWQAGHFSLHQQPLRVVDIQTQDTRWAAQADYVHLVDQASTRHKVTLAFTSPTSFKRTEGYFTPLPQPELVFSSLLDRWNAFAPFRLPDWLYQTVHCEVAIDAGRIQTETLAFARGRKGTVPGFTGKVTYRFMCNKEARRYLNALASFAKYSGVGVKTTVGMGQVQVA